MDNVLNGNPLTRKERRQLSARLRDEARNGTISDKGRDVAQQMGIDVDKISKGKIDPDQTSVSARRLAAEQKLADAARGSRANGVLIGKEGDVPVFQSQQQLKQSLMNAGAQYIGPTRENDGQIYYMDIPTDKKVNKVEIRIMQQRPGETRPYHDNRTIIVKRGSVGQGTGQYTYGNGDAITGDVSRSDRKAIGHTHGQIP